MNNAADHVPVTAAAAAAAAAARKTASAAAACNFVNVVTSYKSLRITMRVHKRMQF